MNVDFEVSLEALEVDGSMSSRSPARSTCSAPPALKDALQDAIAAGARRIVIDMTATRFIDSTTLGVILGASKRLRPRGGELVLVIDHASIRKISRSRCSTAPFRSTRHVPRRWLRAESEPPGQRESRASALGARLELELVDERTDDREAHPALPLPPIRRALVGSARLLSPRS